MKPTTPASPDPRASLVLPALLAALAPLSACGDSLVGTEYHGESLLSLQGSVNVADGARLGDQQRCQRARDTCWREEGWSESCGLEYDVCLEEEASQAAPWESAGAELRIALFWSRSAPAEEGPAAVLEQAVQATAGFPATFELAVYSPPARDVLRSSEAGEFGLAVMLAYLDLDGDGAWDGTTDRIVGGAAPTGILYSEDAWSDFEPGFNQVEVPRGCGEAGLRLTQSSGERVDLRLSTSPGYLDGLLPDVDCDRATIDWPMCPERESLKEECAVFDRLPADPWRCTLCAAWPSAPPRRDLPPEDPVGR